MPVALALGHLDAELSLGMRAAERPQCFPGLIEAVLDESVFAHTSPVYVDVTGQRVARVADAQWCLKFLHTLEQFVCEHGHFDAATRTTHFGDFVAVLEEACSFYRRVAETADR